MIIAHIQTQVRSRIKENVYVVIQLVTALLEWLIALLEYLDLLEFQTIKLEDEGLSTTKPVKQLVLEWQLNLFHHNKLF